MKEKDVPLNGKMCHQRVENVTKFANFGIFDLNSSKNIGHCDLLFGMQIEAHHIINNYHTKNGCALK